MPPRNDYKNLLLLQAKKDKAENLSINDIEINRCENIKREMRIDFKCVCGNIDNKNNNKITSCWGVNGNGICCVKKTKKNEWEHRLNILKDNVNYWINDEHKTDKTIEVVELFYDSSLYNV